MKRRQLLQSGLAVGSISAVGGSAIGKVMIGTGSSGSSPIPYISTRDHFEERSTYNGRRYDGRKVLPTEGHTKTDYDTVGSVPGVDRGCVPDLTVVVHGWDKKENGATAESNARDKFLHYRGALQDAGYTGEVVGYSWDSDIGGSTFFSFPTARKCAEKNGPKLARFISEYHQACSNGILRLVCHSFGGHVTVSALKTLAANKSWLESRLLINSIHLLGAATDNEAPTPEWPTSYRGFAYKVHHTFNYWNSEDNSLAVYPDDQPLGESGVEPGNTPPPNFTDRQVTAKVGDDHSGYMDALAPMIVRDMYQVAKPATNSNRDTDNGNTDNGDESSGDSGRFSNGDQVKSTVDLNTRKRPSTDAAVRATLVPGTPGTVVGGPTRAGGYTWWKIRWTTNDLVGWSVDKYLNPGSGDKSSDETDESDEGSRFSSGDHVASTVNLNTRAKPGTGSRVLKTMSPGSVGTITDGPTSKGSYTWWKVNWNAGVHGWSAGKYLNPSSGGGDSQDDSGPPASSEADRWVAADPSNYTNGSRGGGEINWIVLHVTQGSYGGAVSWFKNPSANVSAHYVIRNSDGHTTQMVKHEDTAWHAGGRNHNQYSIGIEHEGHVGKTSFTDALYKRSAAIVRSLCEQYNIPKRHYSGTAPLDASAGGGIIGHNQVPENSHTDPGSTWDWDQFMALVNGNDGGRSGDDGTSSDDSENSDGGGNDSNSGGPFSNGDTVAATTNLNTRKQPGTGSRVLKTMKPGATGEIMNGPTQKGGYTWWGVRWNVGNEYLWGWSVGKYLKPSDGSGQSDTSGGSDNSGSAAGVFSDGDRVRSTVNLNTRKQPGTGSRVLKTMKPGATGEIMNGPIQKGGYTWWGVRWNVGNEYLWGWSVGKYLEKQ